MHYENEPEIMRGEALCLRVLYERFTSKRDFDRYVGNEVKASRSSLELPLTQRGVSRDAEWNEFLV